MTEILAFADSVARLPMDSENAWSTVSNETVISMHAHVRRLESGSAFPKDITFSKAEHQISRLAERCAELANGVTHCLCLGSEVEDELGASSHKSARSRRNKITPKKVQASLHSIDREAHLNFQQVLQDSDSALNHTLRRSSSMQSQFQSRDDDHFKSPKENILRGIKDLENVNRGFKSHADVLDQLRQLLDIHTEVASENKLLKMLHFPELGLRHHSVEERHSSTFEWAFQDCHDSLHVPLAGWLKEGAGSFWISGKAGAGKSTFMKWLVADSRTQDLLIAWAGPRLLITGSFFFWHAGTDLEKSQEGLLRSLLFGLVRGQPSRRHVLEARLKELNLLSDFTPKTQDLAKMLRAYLLACQDDFRFCFFIDGLDEYTGSLQDIIDVIRDIAKLSNVKVCISSRPWKQIASCFGDDETRSLVLHKHTAEDFEKYVAGVLADDTQYQSLLAQPGKYGDLPALLIEKAQGVFLWVVLIVRSLREVILYGAPTPAELLAHIEGFPAELDLVYERMLRSIRPEYRPTAAKILLVRLKAEAPLSILAFSEFGEQMTISAIENAIDCSPSKLLIKKYEDEQQYHAARVTARCLDFLELHQSVDKYLDIVSLRVDFLHRTAQDFLLKINVQRMLKQWSGEGFDADYVLCAGLALALARNIGICLAYFPDKYNDAQIGRMIRTVNQFEAAHHRYRLRSGVSANSLLDKLQTSIQESAAPASLGLFWREAFQLHSESHPPSRPLIVMAVRNGWTDYTLHCIEMEPEIFSKDALYNTGNAPNIGNEVLSCAFVSIGKVDSLPATTSRDVQALLGVSNGCSEWLWQCFISEAAQLRERVYGDRAVSARENLRQLRSKGDRDLTAVAKVLLEAGGDLYKKVAHAGRYGRLGGEGTPWQILRDLLSDKQMEELERTQGNALTWRIKRRKRLRKGQLPRSLIDELPH